MKLLTVLVFLVSITLQAQIQLKGKISDEFGFVISDCLVYVDGSSHSTYSDSEGNFSLNLPNGNYVLVFRMDEFDPHSISVNASQANLAIQLKKTTIQLNEAVIVPISKGDWANYFETFKANFLGKNKAGTKCEIVNPKAIKFRYDKETRILTARATEPLIIQNNYLGYQIEYDLDEFYVDYKNNQQYMAGTTRFVPQKGSTLKMKTWNENRENSYEGSLMHFIRSLYNQNLAEEGFVIRKITRMENPAYTTYKEKLEANRAKGIQQNLGKMPSKIVETLYNEEIPYEKIVYKRKGRFFIHFEDFLNVEFTKEKEDLEYVRERKNQNLIGNQVSVLSLLGDKVIEIDSNGNFHPPSNLLTEEYFTWEKIGNLLPLDYEP